MDKFLEVEIDLQRNPPLVFDCSPWNIWDEPPLQPPHIDRHRLVPRGTFVAWSGHVFNRDSLPERRPSVVISPDTLKGSLVCPHRKRPRGVGLAEAWEA